MQTGNSLDVLQSLGVSYSYHIEEDEVGDFSLLDLMETTLAENIDLEIFGIEDLPSFPSNEDLEKKIDLDILYNSDLFEETSEEVEETSEEAGNVDNKKLEEVLNYFRDTKVQFKDNHMKENGVKKSLKTSLKRKATNKKRKKDVSSKVCPICFEKVEKENYGSHLRKFHSEEIDKYYETPPNSLEIESFHELKRKKKAQAMKDKNQNLVAENNPRNKCPVCLRINVQNMWLHMRTCHRNLPASFTQQQLLIDLENIPTARRQISSDHRDVLSRLTLERTDRAGVYRLTSATCHVCHLTCQPSVTTSCSSCSHSWHSSCHSGHLCLDCRSQGGGEREQTYQAFFLCAICRSSSKTDRQLMEHYSLVHFKEEMETYVDTAGRCSLCGLSVKSMVRHIGVRHNLVENFLPRSVSVKFKKN